MDFLNESKICQNFVFRENLEKSRVSENFDVNNKRFTIIGNE